MLDAIIKSSLKNRLLVVIAAIGLLVAGAFVVTQIPIDVFPDLTAPTVVILTEAHGMATEEVETMVTFQIENLPHGVIVDNIGLNGVLIPKEQNERQIFLNCARWVGDQDRLCYAIEQNAGRQTSRPLLLKIRRAPSSASR